MIVEPPGTKIHNPTRGRHFQVTFGTPRERLDTFVGTLIGDPCDVKGAWIYVETVVFEPRSLSKLLEAQGIECPYLQDRVVRAETAQEARELLRAALNDWVDFFFELEPGRFALYADHDDFTTLYTARENRLKRTVRAMRELEFEVADYTRPRLDLPKKRPR